MNHFLFRFIVSLFLITTTHVISTAQSTTGIVNTCDGQSLSDVIITQRDTISGQIISFITSNQDGFFIIEELVPHSILHFNKLGYEGKLVLTTFFDQNKSICLEEKAFQIEEVCVKNQRIEQQGDTINYLVNSFESAQDRSIGDVLRKMPGIEVTKEGHVYYNGKPINRLYIEGADLLNDQYALAVKNISSKDIGRVQVYENHQPLKVLEGYEFSERAAINLTLKESSKAVWLKYGELMGGTPSLWKGLVLGMRASKKNQSLNVYKTNNIGEDISFETHQITLDDLLDNYENRSNIEELISINTPQENSLEQKRSLFNKSHLFSSNNLWKLKKDFELRANVNYTNDQSELALKSISNYYYSDDSVRNIIEDQNGTHSLNNYEAKLTLFKNSKENFIENKLTANYYSQKTFLSTTGSKLNTQTDSPEKGWIQNNFSLIRKNNQNLLKIKSLFSYQETPQELRITEPSVPSTIQKVDQREISSNNYISLTMPIGKLSTELKTGFQFKYYSLSSALSNQQIGDHDNETTLSQHQPYLSAKLMYNPGHWKISLTIPMKYAHSALTNHSQSKKYDHFIIYPNFEVNYKLTPKLTAITKFNVNRNYENNSLFNEYILQSYRLIYSGLPKLTKHNSYALSFTLKYRNPIKEFFAASSFTYSDRTSNRLIQQEYLDIYTINHILEEATSTASYINSTKISKGYANIKSTFSIYANYIQINNKQLLNNKNLDLTNQNLNLTSEINSQPLQWLDIKYAFKYNLNTNTIKESSNHTQSSIQNFHHQTDLCFILSSKLQCQSQLDYYKNQITNDFYKECWFLDFQINYFIRSTLEFKFSLLNILNNNNYTIKSNNSIMSLSRRYELRPRSALLGLYFKF